MNARPSPPVAAALTAAGYVAVAWLGLQVASPPGNVSALWPASGLAVAATLAWGRAVWVGVFAASLAINAVFLPGDATWSERLVGAALIAAGNLAEAGLASRIITRSLGGRAALATPERVAGLFAAAATAAATAAAVGATVTALASRLSLSAAVQVGVTWTLGDALGIVVVTPLVLTHDAPPPPPRRWEAVALAALTLTILQTVYGRPFPTPVGLWLPLAWLLLPVVVWCGARYEGRAVAAQVLAVHAVVSWATVSGRGPFALLSQRTALLVQDGFLLSMVLPGLLLSAARAQGARARAALEAERRALEDRVAERTARLEATHRALTDEVEARARLTAQLVEAQKQEALWRLAGGVAHDFNNLLTVISGEAEVLRDTDALPPDARDGAQAIVLASRRAGDLTRQLLAFARRQPGSPARVDVADALARLRRILRTAIPSNVTFEVTGEPGCAVRIDPSHFDQVLLNLCLNARDAMPSGGALQVVHRRLDLDDDAAATRGLAPGAWVELTVRDDGEGIAEALLPRIFEPFFTTRPQGRGTGLGLSTAQGIVTQARGHLRVESAVGEGSTFTVWLPADTGPEASAPAVDAAPAEPARGATILVTEDEPMVRRLVVQLLTRQGYRVLEARDGDEGLAVARAHPDDLDLLLTDVVMPRRGGRELAEALRAERALPVVFMSGHHEHAEALAHERLLPKPFTAEALHRVVAEALAQARATPSR